ncbi:uncharacterized protein LOC110977279, partial [Acanthaster planci]|uniref:Uncharacterized protein LOC110977279 n=1 Tax=Acanthaster planci TaxID=133434 RepID=A0A8B7Y3Q2_ACAPL
RGPQDTIVRQGASVNFTCDLRNIEGYTIYWHHQPQVGSVRYLTVNRELYTGTVSPPPAQLQRRLSITGDESRGEFTLRISDVRKIDDGVYSCLYGYTNIPVKTASSAELTVLVPPSSLSPWCSAQPVSTADDNTINLYCNSQGGEPPPNITYFRETEQIAGPGIRSIQHTYHLREQDNGVTFTCILTTPALDEPSTCSVMPLRILPNATILPAVSEVENRTSRSFECHGEGVPNIATYRWRVTYADTGDILLENNYSVSENGQSLKITVTQNLELLCVVSVQSGLSGHATALVNVTKLVTTTVAGGLRKTASPDPEDEASASLIMPIAVVVVVIASLMLIVFCFLWRRKTRRAIDPKIEYNMRDIRDLETPGTPTDKTGPVPASEQTVYAMIRT